MAKKVKIAETSVVDRLSDLPDSIIHHILSFLDMRLVVQTSTVATRWRNLWACTPNLNFNCTCSSPSILASSEKEKRKRFRKFVNRVLVCRDASNVHKFSLSSQLELDVDHLDTWLIGILRRNVEELYLLSGAYQPFELPPHVFTSDITVLTLSFSGGDGAMQLPDTICSAAKLKSLKLENVELPHGNPELILSCPVLESLSMVSCDDSHLEVFTISAVVLKTLEFSTEPDYNSSCMMNICCPNLTSIMYTCVGNPNLSLMNLPALVSAYISICRDDTIFEEGYSNSVITMLKECSSNLLITILRGIHNVHSLRVGAYTLKDIVSSPSILQMLPSLFTNLRGITVEDSFDADGRTSTSAMANILKTFPSIRALVWDRTKVSKFERSDDEDLEVEEGMMLYGMETVVIRNPCGMKDEIKFIKFLLERAISLKEMSIKVTTGHKKYSREFRHKLIALASTSALLHCPWGVEKLFRN